MEIGRRMVAPRGVGELGAEEPRRKGGAGENR
uniref:Uncharacterized protein n=1 Tax=Arundo donax TaxID=35708 RepID=A0A0A8ZHN2_ARUDO